MDNPRVTQLPTNLVHGLQTYVNKKEGISMTARILLILLIFSLILLIIGTIIILQSYHPGINAVTY